MKIGDMYKQLEDQKGKYGRSRDKNRSLPEATTYSSKQQALNEIGKDRKYINQWVKESNIEDREGKLEEYEATCNEIGEQVTSIGFRNFALNAAREERQENLVQPDLPADKYRIIYADPPWRYDADFMDKYGHAESHYKTMTIDELCDLPIADLTQPDAVLFLWVTSPKLEYAFDIIKAWGFKYKTSFIWDKVGHNFGYYNSVRHEFLLIAGKGSSTPDEKKLYDSVVTIEKSKIHSEKPEYFREIIDFLYPVGNRIELFARSQHEGWDSWGAEV